MIRCLLAIIENNVPFYYRKNIQQRKYAGISDSKTKCALNTVENRLTNNKANYLYKRKVSESISMHLFYFKEAVLHSKIIIKEKSRELKIYM